MSAPLRLGRLLDSSADAWIGPAATDVAGHEGVDVRIGGVLVLCKQRCGRHHLTGLTVAALRYIQRDPGLLDLIHVEAFDRRDFLTGDRAYRRLTRSYFYAVQMH